LVNYYNTNHLDNYNGLLLGLPKAQIAKLGKLQRVPRQNSAARLILGFGKFSLVTPWVTPVLYELHWLPVSLRIDYKILLLTFKCIYGLIILCLLVSSYWTIPRERCLQNWEPCHFQRQLRNSGMAYLWSFVKQYHLTVLNLDLRLIFLRSIFIIYKFVLFFMVIVKRY